MSTNPEDLMILPTNLEDLTPAWMTEALCHKYPGTKVTGVSFGDEVHGTASKARLNLDYELNEYKLPSSMYVKGGFAGPEQMALVEGGDGWASETLFYRHYAADLAALEIPRSYYEATDSESGQSILLLENLNDRDVTFGNATRPVTPDTAAATLEWLAKLHGQFWNSSRITGLPAWPGVVKDVLGTLLSDQFWGATIERPLADPVPDELRDPRRVRQALTAMWAAFEDRDPQTLIHADAHQGNMYFLSDGSPGFLDWQTPTKGPWSDDVTYFMIGALSVEDRRQHDRDLIKHYLNCLEACGVDAPSFDNAWLAYRQQVIHGFMWVATPAQMQTDEIVAANTERFCAALVDLETLDALGI